MRKKLERKMYLESQYTVAESNRNYLMMIYYKILLAIHKIKN